MVTYVAYRSTKRHLSKNEFQDALSLRFGMTIKGVALNVLAETPTPLSMPRIVKLGDVLHVDMTL